MVFSRKDRSLLELLFQIHPYKVFQLHERTLCKAYNLIRERWRDVLSLLYMSIPMGLTTLKGQNEIKFIHANLSPGSDIFQAQQEFTKLIKESVGSISVKEVDCN